MLELVVVKKFLYPASHTPPAALKLNDNTQSDWFNYSSSHYNRSVTYWSPIHTLSS